MRKLKHEPLIAVTMGDPAGIGAEVALKALAHQLTKSHAYYCLLGDYSHLVHCAKRFKVRLPMARVPSVSDTRQWKGKVGVLDLGRVSKFHWGKVSAVGGAAAVRYVTFGANLALSGAADALVTAPINKEAIHLAGCPFPGHTELLASLSKCKSFAMMMVGGPFKIVLQSIHVPLRKAPDAVTFKSAWEKLRLTREVLLRWFGLSNPRIGVAGLNPHAGEAGAFGKEEIKVLKPLVRRARNKGWKVTGPHPPDTLFYQAAQGKYDALHCMYHDQGLIPLKLLAFDSGVNLTLGLPFVRTSPDHGTAFDIAGKGKANPRSMIAAIQLAEAICRKRHAERLK